MKGKRRKKLKIHKAMIKANRMKTPGFKSLYARKHAFLVKNGGYGFDYPEPKPWK